MKFHRTDKIHKEVLRYTTFVKTFFTKTWIQQIFVFCIISFLCLHGYHRVELYEDAERIEMENQSVEETVDPASSTSAMLEITATSTHATSTVAIATTSVPVLVYHKIQQERVLSLLDYKKQKSLMRYSVTDIVFKDQMDFLAKEGYTPLTIEEIIKDKKQGTLPRKPIAITFDDGWRSQYDIALPILLGHHFLATFYIYTGAVGGGSYMSWKDIEELVGKHMEIGSHTKTHPKLTKVSSKKLTEELVDSRLILEKRLNISVSDFAYPYGLYNSQVMDAVKKEGYTSARTSKPRASDAFDDLYQIRVIYAPTTLEAFQKVLHF
jgi:peptidoglycan/xylan/chitin deacetylase (PgdA/CDA1 family)